MCRLNGPFGERPLKKISKNIVHARIFSKSQRQLIHRRVFAANKAVNKHLGNLGRSLISLDGMSCLPVIHEESFVNKWVDNISLFD